MAGTVTLTEVTHKPVQKIVFTWTGGTGGDAGKADKTTVGYFTGVVDRVVFTHDGVDTPTNLYDVELNDDDGNDILWTVGTNLAVAAPVHCHPWSSGRELYSAIVETKITLAVTNSGDTKKGVVYVYVRGK